MQLFYINKGTQELLSPLSILNRSDLVSVSNESITGTLFACVSHDGY